MKVEPLGAFMFRRSYPFPMPLALWVCFCAFCNCAGWILSGFHRLNARGYAVAFGTALVSLFVFRRQIFSDPFRRWSWVAQRRRFSRLFPLAFLILSCMAILGGVLYGPSNYDGLAYRTPRVLHWLAEGRWHWIHTDFQRLNTRGCGMEWVTAPFLALTGSDRFLFAINAVCFLLLPGRTFSLFTRMGISSRTAWYWMWLMPTGYCYLLQAASIGNDLFGAFFCVAAIELALRAKESERVELFWLSLIAAGLMTASKTFNLLLLLPWAVVTVSSVRLLLRRPAASLLVVIVAAGASLVPMAVLNFHYCGDWTGQAAERVEKLDTGAPIFHVIVNAVLLFLHNFSPTVFPPAGFWNQTVLRIIPPSLGAELNRHFEAGAAKFELGEMPVEEAAGIGFGISILLCIVLWHRVRQWKRPEWRLIMRAAREPTVLIVSAAWVGALVLMAKSGLSCPARYFAPFYPLMIAPLLVGSTGIGGFYRSPAWRILSSMVFLLAGLLLIVSPPRPLWPAKTVLRTLQAEKSHRPLLRRAWIVYSVYEQRPDAFAPVRAILPREAATLGLITSDDPETSIWRPFGSRRILHICKNDTAETTQRRGIKYFLVSSRVLGQMYNGTLEDWLAENDAYLIARLQLELRAGRAPTEWFLIRRRT